MKLTIDKNTFMKSWNVTERIAAQKSTLSVISGVLCVLLLFGALSYTLYLPPSTLTPSPVSSTLSFLWAPPYFSTL